MKGNEDMTAAEQKILSNLNANMARLEAVCTTRMEAISATNTRLDKLINGNGQPGIRLQLDHIQHLQDACPARAAHRRIWRKSIDVITLSIALSAIIITLVRLWK